MSLKRMAEEQSDDEVNSVYFGDSELPQTGPSTAKKANLTCGNCSDLKIYIDAKFQQLTDFIKMQNSAILSALNHNTRPQVFKQEIIFPQDNDLLCLPKVTRGSIMAYFPLSSEDDIRRMDAAINNLDRPTFVEAFKSVIRYDLKKNIHSLLSKDVVLDFNLDGTHGKTRFKNYENVYSVLKEALGECDVTGSNVEGVIRQALQHAKKHYYKLTSMERSLNRAKFEDPLKINLSFLKQTLLLELSVRM